MTWQIQGIPTPNIYEARAGEDFHRELGDAAFRLVSVEVISGIEQDLGSEPMAAGFAMLSCEVAGPLLRNLSESSPASYAMLSCVNVVPLSRSLNEADGLAGFALVSVLQPSPVSRTINNDTPATAAFALVSCVV